jgi:transcriptional regulator with GAF, ATPase, and Fis domain
MTDARPRFSEDDAEEVETVTRAPPASTSHEVLRLLVVEGPDAGKSIVLDSDGPTRTLVGTGPACTLRLTDPTVSRRHVAFELAPPRYRILDLDSTNGTTLDGVLIRDAWARSGQTLTLGSTTIRLETDLQSQPAPPLTNATRFGQVVGASSAMRRLYPLVERIARSSMPVIIEGETGTGKEVLAESMHELSGRAGPFVVFDCTALSPSLVESELFGHEPGAFPGAVGARSGIFQEADGGTLLIDEIGDLDLPLQAKLLRVIEKGELRRVGGSSVVKVDVRIIAATRRDLDRSVTEGKFRDDLFHRLAGARVELPPLRDRAGDVELLIRYFGERLASDADVVPPHVVRRFVSQPWPGNVRELRNAVARIVALGEAELLPPMESPQAASLVTDEDVDSPFSVARRRAVARFERAYVERLIEKHGGNVSQAARASGLAERYFRLVKARTT